MKDSRKRFNYGLAYVLIAVFAFWIAAIIYLNIHCK